MQWHYLEEANGQQTGPVDENQIKSLIKEGQIQRESMVWNDAMDSWLAASETRLSECFATISPAPPTQRASTPATPATPAARPAVPASAGFGRDDSQVYPTNPPRSPHMAWLSLLFPGVAQIFFGKTYLGVICIVAALFLVLTGIGYLFVLIAVIIDAYMTGNRLKEGQPVGKWQLFPRKRP